MPTVVGLDLETTGLEPERHEIWEIGAIVRDHRVDAWNGEWRWLIRPNLRTADAGALRVGRFYERFPLEIGTARLMESPLGGDAKRLLTRDQVAADVAPLLDGAHLVGAVPAFDAAFLSKFLRAYGQAPTWHHHLIDVEALTVGYLAGKRAGFSEGKEFFVRTHKMAEKEIGGGPANCFVMEAIEETTEYPYQIALPWRSDDLSTAVEVEPAPEHERHTALGDARWALRIYDAIADIRSAV